MSTIFNSKNQFFFTIFQRRKNGRLRPLFYKIKELLQSLFFVLVRLSVDVNNEVFFEQFCDVPLSVFVALFEAVPITPRRSVFVHSDLAAILTADRLIPQLIATARPVFYSFSFRLVQLFRKTIFDRDFIPVRAFVKQTVFPNRLVDVLFVSS